MAMTKRERYIAIGAGSAVGLVLLNWLAVSPYLAWREDVTKRLRSAKAEQQAALDLIDRQTRLQRVWRQMTDSGGLRTDVGAASYQVQTALRNWVKESGMELSSLSEQRRTNDKQFVQVGVRCSGTGTFASINRLLWHIETADFPVRVNDIEIKPRKDEGVDNLSFTMTVSTLALDPEKDKTDTKTQRVDRSKTVGGAVADAGGRS
jgi:type II secretory pathway component PulM